MKSIFKLIYMVAIVFLTCLFLISCKEIDKNISSIEISNLEEVSILKLNNFKYSDIELTVKYENGEDEIINLSSSMMTKEDALKFKQVGKHEVYIYYKDMSIKYNFEIIASSNDFDNVIFTLDETSFIYSGMPCKPNVIVSGKDLTLDEDYSVEYINNINAGTGVVIIKGINDYKGEKVLTFTIDKKTLIIKANNITISGNEKPVFTVSYNGFVYTDDENSLMGTLKITCDYDDSISGNYEINASGYTSNNYNIIYEKGTLSVNNIYLDKAVIELEYLTHAYTGRELKPDCLITIDGQTVSSYNYEIIYENNKDAGIAKVVIVGKNLYYGRIEKEFTITKVNLEISINNEEIKYLDLIPNYKINYIGFVNLDNESSLDGKLNIECSYDGTEIGSYPLILSGLTSNNYNIIYKNGLLKVNSREIDSVTIEYEEITYAGKYLTPEIKCLVNKNELVLGKDFVVKYENNLNSGKAVVYISGQGNFKGTITKTFTINKAKLKIKVTNMTIDYGDDYPEFSYITEGFQNEDNILSLSGTLLFNTTYKNNSKIGIYDVYVYGVQSDNYLISFEKGLLTVNSKEIIEENIILDNTSFTYTGREINPIVKVNVNKTLGLNTDYKIEIQDNLFAGTGKVIVTGIGNYSGIVTKQFTIAPKDLHIVINGFNIKYGDELASYDVSYNGFVNGEDLANLEGNLLITTDYKKFSNVGTYLIEGSGLTSNNYKIIYDCGKINVSPQNLSNVTYSIESKDYVYSAEAIKPELTLSYMLIKLKENTDYTISLLNNINYGKATLEINGINNYTGTIKDTFIIQKRNITIKANDYSLKYLEEVEKYDCIITNLPDAYNQDLVKTELVFSTTYEKGKKIGNYELIVSGFAQDNFNVTYEKGIITLAYTDKFNGEGTLDNPYILSNVNDIMGLSEKVLSGKKYKNKHFILANDIDFSGYSLTPIGDKDHYFQGYFNGKGREIKNFSITGSKSSYIGLFANVVDGEITNLGLNNIVISNNNCANLGALVGFIKNGIIKNAYVKNANLSNNTNAVIGSICGYLVNSKIYNAYFVSTLNITGGFVTIGSIAGKIENSIIDSSYGCINADINIEDGSFSGITSATNESSITNTFIDGNINVTSDKAKINEISEGIKGTYVRSVNLLNTLTITKNEEKISIKLVKSLSEVVSIFKENIDINDWVIFDDKLPQLTFEENNGVKLINKPQSLKKEYDGLSASYFGFTLDKSYINAGTYEAILKLKEGFMWSDGTTDDITISLEITKKNLYININSLHIHVGDNYDLTFASYGLVKSDENLLDEITLICDYNLNSGIFLINMLPVELDNYNVIIREGYLYVSENGYNDWSVWDGNISDATLEGSGTSLDPYVIDSAAKLASLVFKTKKGDPTNYYYELRTNIDLNYNEWEPIADGNDLYSFEGYFNGNGYVIKNLKITKNHRYVGLFGCTTNAQIESLRLENVDIDLNTYVEAYIGSLIGYSESTQVSKVSSEGQIKVNVLCSYNIICGGLIGYQTMQTTLSNVYSEVNISITNSDEQSSQSPFNVGGIAGYLQDGSILTCYAIGDIKIQNLNARTYVGGIIGYGNKGQITNAISYMNIDLKGKLYYIDYIIGGQQQVTSTNIVALNENKVIVNDTTVVISLGTLYSSGELETFVLENFDDHIWDINDYLYPTLH